MPAPICVGCRKTMTVDKTGASALYGVDLSADIQTVDVLSCERYVCPSCGASVLSGFAKETYRSKICLSALSEDSVVVTTLNGVASL